MHLKEYTYGTLKNLHTYQVCCALGRLDTHTFIQIHKGYFTYAGSIVGLLQCYWGTLKSWWRHQMETFSALLALCVGNSPVTGEYPSRRPVTRSFDVFFDLCLNKRWSKQSWGWWFEAPSRSLWRHRNVYGWIDHMIQLTKPWYNQRLYILR